MTQTIINMPDEFAMKIADSLNWQLAAVQETFEFSEDKQGFFWAKLRPKTHLDKPDFIAVCKLTRDLGGEDYLQGARAWKVPGPLAKKPSEQTTCAQQVHNELRCVKSIPLGSILIPAFLPTRELIAHENLAVIRDSMKKHGLKYAVKVRPSSEPDRYDLVDGYLRFTSAQQLGWKEILAEVSVRSDEQVIVESVVTNKDRIEDDPITLAKKLDMLVNSFGWTQEKVAEELGLDRSSVSHYIRLLQLPKEVQHCVALHNVSFYHALQLLTLQSPELQAQLADEIVKQGLSTRDLEARILEVQPKPETQPSREDASKQGVQGDIARKQIVCSRCGQPITDMPIHLGDNRFYDADCAEQMVAESKQGLIPMSHEQPSEEHAGEQRVVLEGDGGAYFDREQEPETGKTQEQHEVKGHIVAPSESAVFTCGQCKQAFRIVHLSSGKHELRSIGESS